MRVSLAALLIALCMSACTDSAKQASRLKPNITPAIPAARSTQPHWILFQQLRSMTGNLQPGGAPDATTPAGRAAQAAGNHAAMIANDLSDEAPRIPEVMKGKPVSEADLRAFIAIAQTLHDQAHQLRTDAETLHVDSMRQTLAAMTQSCAACHTRFNDFAGSLTPTPTNPTPLNPPPDPSPHPNPDPAQ